MTNEDRIQQAAKEPKRTDFMEGRIGQIAYEKAAAIFHEEVVMGSEKGDPREIPYWVAVRLLAARHAYAVLNYDEAYHRLYSIADPEFTSLEPWKALEDIAAHPERLSQKDEQIKELVEGLEFCQDMTLRFMPEKIAIDNRQQLAMYELHHKLKALLTKHKKQ